MDSKLSLLKLEDYLNTVVDFNLEKDEHIRLKATVLEDVLVLVKDYKRILDLCCDPGCEDKTKRPHVCKRCLGNKAHLLKQKWDYDT